MSDVTIALTQNTVSVAVGNYNPFGVDSSAAFGTDNVAIRSDGTGRGVQSSKVVIADTGGVTTRQAATQDGIAIIGRAGGTGTYTATVTPLTLSDNRTISVPDASGTVALTSDIANQVTAASAFGTDNRIMRSDGTGRGAQASSITVDDSGNLSGAASVVIGTDPTGSELLRVGGGLRTLGQSVLVSSYNGAAASESTPSGLFGNAHLPGRYAAIGYSSSEDVGFIQSYHSGTGLKALWLNPNGGAVVLKTTTDATSATDTSASLNTAGGLAVAKAGHFGTSLFVDTTLEVNNARVAGGNTWIRFGKPVTNGATDVGISWTAYVDDALYCDYKVGLNQAIKHRCGHNTEYSSGRTWLEVTASTGHCTFMKLSVSDTTDAIDKDTGAIVTEGGIAAEKSAWLGGQLGMSATSATTTEGKLQVESGQAKHYAFTNGIGGWVSKLIFSQYAVVTQSGVVTSQSLFSATAIGTRTLPANFWKTGKMIRLRLSGVYTTDASPGNATVDIKLGSTTFRTTGSFGLDASETDSPWRIDLCITCFSTGATGSVHGQLSFDHVNSGGTGKPWHGESGGSTSAVTIDTTASMAVDVQWTATDAGTSITCSCAHIWEEG